MSKLRQRFLPFFLFLLVFSVSEAYACDTSPVITAANTVDIGGGFYTVDLTVCIGTDGSQDGFDLTMGCGLNITATSAASLTNGGNVAVSSIAGGVLSYVYTPVAVGSWWEPDDGISGPCFNMTLTVDGDPAGCTVTTTGVNDGCLIIVTSWATTVAGPPPACNVDYVMSGTGSQAGSTAGGGDNCTLRASQDQIVQVDLACNDTYTFDICGSTWDTYLYLSTTCCGPSIASNDDGCGLQSSITQVLAAGTYYITIEAFSSGTTGSFTLNVAGTSPCFLPVELSYFYGDYDEKIDGNLLHWATSSEFENDYFIVEKINSNNHFEPIGQVLGNGNSQETIRYAFEDLNVEDGTSYYRLTQVDFSGGYEYSDIVAITRLDSDDLLITNLSPNPAGTNFLFKVENDELEEPITIQIVDFYGRVVRTEEIGEKLNAQYSVDVSTLASGIYSIQFTSGNRSNTQKLSVVH